MNEENDQVISSQNKWLVLGHTRDKVEKESLKSHGLVYLAGYVVKKNYDYQHHKTCPKCFSCVSYGKRLSEEEKCCMAYDTSLLNAKDRGGLTWPSETMMFFCAMCLDVMQKKLDDENLLNEFYSSSSRVGTKVADF